MVLEIRTLIILDTNVLRSTKEREVAYGTFEFGLPYTKIESFVLNNGLSDLVEIAVPRVVVDELKKQKTNSYHSDVKKLTKIHSRLSKMPNLNGTDMKLLETGFDYSGYVEQLAEKYISEKKVRIIEIPKGEQLEGFFHRILERALTTTSPFKPSHNYSDAGFKDALIWECILNYGDIREFHKVILATRDTGFDEECIKEFENATQVGFSILPSEDLVTNELSSTYEGIIRNKDLYDYAKTDYFTSYLGGQFAGQKFVVIEDQKFPISRWEILNPCTNIEDLQNMGEEDQQDTGGRVVTSQVKVTFKKEGTDSEIGVDFRTLVDEERNLSPLDSDPEVTDS